MKKILTAILKFFTHEWVIVALLVVISGVAHGYNMFQFPYYESDEGTYMAQAWSVLSEGKLAPYTYWYDHSPAGWIFMSLWIFLTGGPFTFGFALNSGRVFMLVLHIASTLLLYYNGKKLTGSKLAGLLIGLFFSLTPLGIYFQRRVLLDNIMVFWVLLSMSFILFSRKRLKWILWSGIAFGIAVLSKENAIFFYPIFMYLVWTEADKKNRIFAFFTWSALSLSLVSLYFFYALLKGELFPTGTALGGQNEHVSLFGTLKFQASRGQESILRAGSSFWSMYRTWKGDDFGMMATGIFSTIAALLLGIKNRALLIAGLFALSYWAFLLRGGLVLEFYVIPLIAVMAFASGMVFWKLYDILHKRLPSPVRFVSYVPILIAVVILLQMVFVTSDRLRKDWNVWTSDQTTAQVEAVKYILSKNLPNEFYVIDMYAYLDLNLKNNNNFKNAEYYWKVDGDKEIRDTLLKKDPNNIDFILFSPLIGGDLGTGELPMTGRALANSNPITSFDGDGWYMQLWAVKNRDRILSSAWDTYKNKFIKDGRVIDRPQENATTSEAQAYALLRAVWMDDQKTFDEVLAWTKINMQGTDGMHAWMWQNGEIADKGFATDADEDIALALLFAYNKWHEPQYLKDGKVIVNAVWNNAVVNVGKEYYLTPGDWADKSNEIVMNPSYLSPATYKIFAQVDKKHPWTKVTDTSYKVLEACTKANLDTGKGVLPPDWCSVNKNTLQVQKAATDPNGTLYGYDAFRVPWRVALDYQWYKDKRALAYLKSLTFLKDEWKKEKKLTAVYTHDGKVWEQYETAAAYAADLGYFSIVDRKTADVIYNEKVLKKFYEDKDRSYWEDPENYYIQNWAWFGTALYTNNLPNLWNK
jgi:endo-1,4-beta-D-glucanase Y/4-amino-4-deoxy-L-arabinose transferase-like glycosyltransferase